MDKSFLLLDLPNNLKIVLPEKLSTMSTYICMEQGDWFEEEIKFLRKYISEGMSVIDIGANFGFYSLTFSKLVGTEGKVYAFEPDINLNKYLKESVEINKIENLVIQNLAISNISENIDFYLSNNSELNSKTYNKNIHSTKITVPAKTLDGCYKESNWGSIDFIKIDAEGEEINILKGSSNFLREQNPLIMLECSHVKFKDLAKILYEHKYKFFRLVKELDLLVPLENENFISLNIFCCKDEKIKELQEKDLLLKDIDYSKIKVEKDLFVSYLNNLNFSKNIISKWLKNIKDDVYIEAVNLYIDSLNEKYSKSEKFHLLEKSVSLINSIEEQFSTITKTQTTIRILSHFGLTTKFSSVINSLLENDYFFSTLITLDEVFLPVLKKFEAIEIINSNKWLLSSFIEFNEFNCKYSSYFSIKDSIRDLKLLNQLQPDNLEVKKRITLIHNALKSNSN